MKGIGGNTDAIIQVRTTTVNTIGEDVETWEDVQPLHGWMDTISGESNYNVYATKVLGSTNIFMADYKPLDARISEENSRLVHKGKQYDVMLIDNPMGMGSGSQLEIYLKYTGGQ